MKQRPASVTTSRSRGCTRTATSGRTRPASAATTCRFWKSSRTRHTPGCTRAQPSPSPQRKTTRSAQWPGEMPSLLFAVALLADEPGTALGVEPLPELLAQLVQVVRRLLLVLPVRRRSRLGQNEFDVLIHRVPPSSLLHASPWWKGFPAGFM